jgi:hypothetical protein
MELANPVSGGVNPGVDAVRADRAITHSRRRSSVAARRPRTASTAYIQETKRGLRGLRGDTTAQKGKYAAKLIWSVLSLRWLSKNMSRSIETSTDMFDQLQTQWATTALVSALMLSVIPATADFTIYPKCDSSCSDFMNLFHLAAWTFFLTSLLMVILFNLAINTINKRFTTAFMFEFKILISLPEFFLMAGIFTTAGVTLAKAHFATGKYMFGPILCVVLGATGLLLLTLYYIVFVLDKKDGIWEKSAMTNANADLRSSGSSSFIEDAE